MAPGVLFHHAGMSDGSHDVLDLFITLAIGLSLAFLHVWSPYVHPGSYIDSRYWLPFADGISITYIFLQLLPEITHLADEELHLDEPYVLRFGEWLEPLSAWGEQNPFLPLLLGFTLFYGLERGIERPVDHGARDGAERPVRMSAHSQCFRSEAGSAGKDTAGMLRQHQFNKVEMVSITRPEDSREELDRMTT